MYLPIVQLLPLLKDLELGSCKWAAMKMCHTKYDIRTEPPFHTTREFPIGQMYQRTIR